MLARFCNTETIAYSACNDPNDQDHQGLQQMEQELSRFTRSDGQAYRLVPLPTPRPVFNNQGDRLPASYANFLIINGAVLVPLYGDEDADAFALTQLRNCFPDRKLVGLPACPLIEQGGSIHCVTMQLPQALISPSSDNG